MHNKYYTGKLPNSDMSQVYKVIVGNAETQVKSPNDKDIVVKLHQGDDSTHDCLNRFTELTHQEAVELVASWSTDP
jgi:hypothetical protein